MGQRDYKVGQRDYKVRQGLQSVAKGLQSGAGITKWCSTVAKREKHVVNSYYDHRRKYICIAESFYCVSLTLQFFTMFVFILQYFPHLKGWKIFIQKI